ncbi:MAG: DNA polymerase III subunit gamma/tau [Patescibacteria group bacterium]
MATLYRQYRPQNFTEILGQNYIKTILQNEILSNKIAQAYLFCGPRAVGKTTMARVLAKAVNCSNLKEGEYEPCNECPSCVNINTGRNLDIIEIDAASNTGVDNVRDNIISSSRVGSNNSHYKVFIIDEVHMLSISAFNALLKVLEEPPQHVIFILCTTEIHKVPNTIISRCQRFDFKRISVADMVKKLDYIVHQENIKIDKSILESIARHSDGHLRDAESLLGQIISIGGDEITQAEADLVIPKNDLNEIVVLLDYLSRKDAIRAIQLVNNLADNGINLKNFVIDMVEILRQLMLGKVNPSLTSSLGLDLGESLEMKLVQVSADLSLEQIIKLIEKFSSIIQEVKNSFIAQLPLELAIIEFSLVGGQKIRVSSPPTVTAVKEKVIETKIEVKESSDIVEIKEERVATIVDGNSGVGLSREQIVEKWSEVAQKIKPLNHSLSFVLLACEITSIKDCQLCLTFKYRFHKDRVDSIQIKPVLEKLLLEIYGAPLSVKSILDENLVIAPIEPVAETLKESNSELSGAMDNVLKAFGGEIIN